MPDIAIVGGGPSGLAFAGICERRGLSYTVYERSARDTPPRGGCLDLHPGSGQRAMKAAGVFDEFKKYARGGDASIHKVYDHQGNQVFSWGEDRDSPELDRHEIRETLLTGVHPEKIIWKKKLEKAERDESGSIVLRFEDGSFASGFKLVVGADGTHSRVRPLITSAVPHSFDVIFFVASVTKTNPFYKVLEKEAGAGPLVVMGRQNAIWIQIQGSGEYQCSFGVRRPAEFLDDLDVSNSDAMKKLLMSAEFFGEFTQFHRDALQAVDTPLRAWPIWEMPPAALDWKPSSDVTLIGDAAHTTSPFLGEGANMAMLDAVLLADRICEYGIGSEAIGAYEQEMFEKGKTMITGSNFSGRLFFAPDAPTSFVKEMKERHMIGANDGQHEDTA